MHVPGRNWSLLRASLSYGSAVRDGLVKANKTCRSLVMRIRLHQERSSTSGVTVQPCAALRDPAEVNKAAVLWLSIDGGRHVM
jgi:hypothetical protein